MFVYVLNHHGQPLMPCSPRKARVLLQQGKATVVQRTPFTIRLRYGSSGYKQAVSLGVDAGTKHLGLSATTEKKVLFEADMMLRTDIQALLSTRRAFRRARRHRKTRYRQPRFLNRKKPEGWLPPSVQNKVDAHVKVIQSVLSILPITHITVEVAQFDIQKIKNPDIAGIDYQQGEQMGFWNVREYVLFRDNHTCQYCRGLSGDKILNVHHIESRKTGGDAPDNLITLCETCHDTIHRAGLTHLFQRPHESFRDAIQMTVMRWFIYRGIQKVFPHADVTYGYMTKNTRIRNCLQKNHLIDARCISGHPMATPLNETYLIKQVRGQNRQLHKATILKGGVRKANKSPKVVLGFQLFDKVRYNGQECFIFGRRLRGAFDLRLLDGTKITSGASHHKLMLLERASTLLIQLEKGEKAASSLA
ncbi:RNA-guided endonuclease IscB [Sulfobacillus sp. hq2]|uniref:RNA-guided endonuclease IscB n=1 Tax=Sulfobacillus sp. hq2 TaxID=2039167 RepID=UPI000CD0089A|nr:RNA-guided endonuclease IscB [Sulfobacillus sp. hq2]POB12196.1 HNH endonuclease [Sulfobacillus sp. hq2]